MAASVFNSFRKPASGGDAGFSDMNRVVRTVTAPVRRLDDMVPNDTGLRRGQAPCRHGVRLHHGPVH
ncbi:hypothetical protein [Rhodopila sp.]|uniref:hypothetical protein n=1 Tax=Rhodopila sp. TaxID=2480087 RepID=UPI002D80F667|nr:hypothetical protein [Rhodopila sp.]